MQVSSNDMAVEAIPSVEAEISSVSLILPAWNEADAINGAIEEADAALRQISDEYEIIVVDDGSRDATADLVRNIAVENPAVRLISHGQNLGYGAALRNGFAAATKNLVVFTDADRQFDLAELDRFALLSKRYDIVCGYRIDRKDSFLRCLYSRVYNHLVRLLLGTKVRDIDCAMKMFRREVVQDLTISTDGFLVNSELLTQANQKQYSIVEVGVTHRPRVDGHSTVSASHIPRVLKSLVRYWWNTIQFPSQGGQNGRSGIAKSSKEPKWIGWAQRALILFAAIFLFANLGYPLIDRDETRYAEISREMLVTNNWALPQLNFEPYYDKPPLLYWLCAASYKMFGISEWSARLVPAIAAFLTLLSTLWFGSRLFGRTAGVISATVLLLSAGFAFTSRYLLIDGVLTFLVSLSLFTAYESILGKSVKLHWWMASAVCCGLACMAKGPLSLILLLPPVFAFAWLSDSCAKPRWWHYALTFATVGIITAPWLVAVTLQDSNFVLDFLYRHNLKRFSGEFHARPFWFFVPVLMVAGHPWSFLTIPYTKFLFSRQEISRATRSPALGFLLLWSGWCFVFFSLAKCKLPTYLLPASPALALMIGHYLNNALSDTRHMNRYWFARFWSARSATATTCFAGVGFVIFALYEGFESSYSLYLWAMLWTTLLVSSLLMLSDRHQGKLAWASSAGITTLFVVMVMHQMVPMYSRSQTILGVGSPLAKAVGVLAEHPVVTISHEFSEIPFYLQRSDVIHLRSADARRLQSLVESRGAVTVILDKHLSPEQLAKELPGYLAVRTGMQRGPATFVRLSSIDPPQRIASSKERGRD
ncbi:glycosyltransferase [Rubripirellula reticaptiva]|uniref:Undecaprenyl phosphate-alpha-4-amino-4-deoxy-L-arabinose arabinosyl transferase n=1 Tax=Rubripirellula reticaptiva TaxID=2528013 RepID=A0A5C6EUV6_9BACT|nr:glycosyltransferase [Rubripirellula reticaptiva]TWU51406.1 Undecaprenyl phosphate-alpha-4-amino-4-deoxy-L-arabinose arabinosyl transferase [Rubripirellula reticaptiva]